MTESCRHERIETKALFRLTGIPFLEYIDEDDTHLLELSVVNNETLRVKFHARLTSPHAEIFEVTSLRHFVNVTSTATLVQYAGPPYALFNATTNCTVGITELKRGRVYGNCTEINYSDEQLSKYEPVGGTPAQIEELSRPVVYVGPLLAYIQCFKYRIHLGSREFPCPYHPFAVDIQVSFRVLDLNHEVVEYNEIKLPSEVQELQTFAPEKSDGFREKAHEAFIKLNQLNSESLRPRMKVTAEKLEIPVMEARIAGAATIAVLATCAVAVWCCSRTRAKQEPNRGGNNVQIYSAPSGPLPPIPLHKVPAYYPNIGEYAEVRKEPLGQTQLTASEDISVENR